MEAQLRIFSAYSARLDNYGARLGVVLHKVLYGFPKFSQVSSTELNTNTFEPIAMTSEPSSELIANDRDPNGNASEPSMASVSYDSFAIL